jgi:hypothetical protein
MIGLSIFDLGVFNEQGGNIFNAGIADNGEPYIGYSLDHP